MSKLKVVERLKLIQKRIEELASKQVVVGALSDTRSDIEMTNAELLATHEFGNAKQGIPERPVMRTALSKGKDDAQKLLSKSVSECLNGDISAEMVYEKVGMMLRNVVVETFNENDFVPNSPQTIKEKGSSKPLIDTGALRGSINYEVRERE